MNNKYINPNEYGSLLYDDKEIKYTENVIKQRRIFRYSRTEYPYVALCEDKIKSIVNSKYALCTTNGTSGLKTALVGAGVKKNDRVLISSYTFLATALAVIALGAIPVPIEIDLNNGVNLDDINEVISKVKDEFNKDPILVTKQSKNGQEEEVDVKPLIIDYNVEEITYNSFSVICD